MHSHMKPEDMRPVPSPCINICEMDQASGLCRGCLRTIDEIVGWGQAGDEAKRAVWLRIRAREEKLFG